MIWQAHVAVKTVSEANSHEHWRKRAARAKHHRLMARAACDGAFWRRKPRLPCTITLTRIEPRKLDSDNVYGACKHVRDGVADWLGIDDGDERIAWLCKQEKPAKGERRGVRIDITEAAC